MINVIKTAIVTIMISIISGLLLDYVKNVAPRILLKKEKCVPLQMNGKKVYAYKVNVSNMSKKTVHDLTLNIQSKRSGLKIADARITNGLKFNSTIKENNVDISMPFISKGDKFSVTIYVENPSAPLIALRSPENFKEIDSESKNGVLAYLLSIPKGIKEYVLNTTPKDAELGSNGSGGRLSKAKRTIILGSVIVFVVLAVILVKLSFKAPTNNVKDNSAQTNVNKTPTDKAKTTDKSNTSTGSTTQKSNTKSNTNTNPEKSNTNTSSGSGTTKNSDTGTSTPSTTTNTNTNSDTNNQKSGTTSSDGSSNTQKSENNTSNSGNTSSSSSSDTSKDTKSESGTSSTNSSSTSPSTSGSTNTSN
ncbi:hypothetical protein [Clostridium felsineum]|uniref:hypothetical protein n=1 Tax=Clostridium felsineum TaxID=36839 RepID=UPI00098C9086|nr:hypothetical protein [Clostridium felsineum]URZ01645.1 hypothetical protein CLAUR_016400 [Clostridium felsineum]